MTLFSRMTRRKGVKPVLPLPKAPDVVSKPVMIYQPQDITKLVSDRFPQVIYAEIHIGRCRLCGNQSYIVGEACIHCTRGMQSINEITG